VITYDDLTPAEFAEWGVAEYCPHPSRLLGYACRRDGELVAIGCVWVDEDERWWGAFGGKPGFPHGIHRKTLELFAALERAGVTEIWAEPDAQVVRSREWLERLGFVRADQQSEVYRRGLSSTRRRMVG